MAIANANKQGKQSAPAKVGGPDLHLQVHSCHQLAARGHACQKLS